MNLKILTDKYLTEYSSQLNLVWIKNLDFLNIKETYSVNDFEFYIQQSATYSSNIEGNSIDFDTFLKNKKFKIKSKPKEMAEIDDLILAYNYAMNNKLNQLNFFETHKMLSKKVLSLKSQRGKLRNQQVGIFSEGRIEYMAVEPELVKVEFDKLFDDINTLLLVDLSPVDVFYFASFIHLMFEKIHPFMDGNGRAGRLLEKWFLAEKLGYNTWSIQSEKFYSKNITEYYKNIYIGYNYYSLKFEKCLPFLLMLPCSLDLNKK
ncbi:MAG: Fic family protein [Bacteroidota bacterium]